MGPSYSCLHSLPPPVNRPPCPCSNPMGGHFSQRFLRATTFPSRHRHRLPFPRLYKPPPMCWSAGRRLRRHCRRSMKAPTTSWTAPQSPSGFKLAPGKILSPSIASSQPSSPPTPLLPSRRGAAALPSSEDPAAPLLLPKLWCFSCRLPPTQQLYRRRPAALSGPGGHLPATPPLQHQPRVLRPRDFGGDPCSGFANEDSECRLCLFASSYILML